MRADTRLPTADERTTTAPIADDTPGSGGLSLRSNFSWTLAGNVVYAGCQWGMLIVIARLGTPEKVGRFALGLAVTAPIIMLANLQLRSVLATDSKREYGFGDYLGLRIVTATVAMIVVTAVALVGYGKGAALVILAIGAAKVCESLSDIYYGLAQQNERMDRVAMSLLVKGPLSLAVLAGMFYLTSSVFWSSAGLAAAWAAVLVSYDFRTGVILGAGRGSSSPHTHSAVARPVWNRCSMGSLTRLAMPLGLAMMLISANYNIPRYFIERCLGERQLGIFAAMAYLMVAGTTVVSALAQSAIPRMAKHYASGDASSFSRLLVRLAGFGATVGLLGVGVASFAGRPLLNMLYGPAYAARSDVFILIAVASAVSLVQWFLSNGMTAARCFRVQAPLYASITAVITVCCTLMIPAYGLLGAALAVLAGEVFLASCTVVIDLRAISRLSGDR